LLSLVFRFVLAIDGGQRLEADGALDPADKITLAETFYNKKAQRHVVVGASIRIKGVRPKAAIQAECRLKAHPVTPSADMQSGASAHGISVH
jgi:hypothetical protein